MNAKKAKLLRKAAAYKNQSATPGVMDFPGIARAVKVPVFEKHEAIKTSYVWLPMDDGFTKVHTPVERLTIRGRKPVPILHTGGVDEQGKSLAGTPRYELLPLTKPGKLREKEPKGVYRQLKKLSRRHGLFTGGQARMLADLARFEKEGAAA
jgi:hypothetical protein